MLQRCQVVALRFGQAHDECETLVAIEQLPGFFATSRNRKHVLNIADVESVAVQRGAARFGSHAQAAINVRVREYNEERPKKALGGLTPAKQLAETAATNSGMGSALPDFLCPNSKKQQKTAFRRFIASTITLLKTKSHGSSILVGATGCKPMSQHAFKSKSFSGSYPQGFFTKHWENIWEETTAPAQNKKSPISGAYCWY